MLSRIACSTGSIFLFLPLDDGPSFDDEADDSDVPDDGLGVCW